MLNSKLVDTLYQRGLLAPNVEIDITYRGVDMAGDILVSSVGTFLIRAVSPSPKGGYALDLTSVVDGHRRRANTSQIVRIDGMEPDRFASVFNIGPDGETMKARRRRLKAEIMEEEAEFADEDEDDDDIAA